jgi:hypothetical protein
VGTGYAWSTVLFLPHSDWILVALGTFWISSADGPGSDCAIPRKADPRAALPVSIDDPESNVVWAKGSSTELSWSAWFPSEFAAAQAEGFYTAVRDARDSKRHPLPLALPHSWLKPRWS